MKWVICVLLMLVSCRVPEPEPVLTFDELIELAGSAATDAERYDWYMQMADDVSGDPTLQQEWEDLRVFMDQWTNGRATYWEPGDQSMAGEGGYLAGFFVQLALPGLTSFPSVIRENSPLYPIWAMYRGRMLIWWAIEMGTLTEAYYEEGRTLLALSREAFPKNPVLPAYLEDPVPWTLDLEVPESAPDWAVAQRELLEKLSHIIAFWVDERQAPDGQFGGGWGDDVEMWRRWTPILLGFEDPVARDAQRLLAEGLYDLPRMEGVYTHILTDVEHTSEDSADTITPMLHLYPEETLWAQRATTLADLMTSLWTAENDQGYLQFKSTYFSSETVETNPDYACDTNYHIRALQPTLLLWQRTEDEALTALFSDWMDTWVAAAATNDRDKPAGIVPSSIHYPSGRPGGPSGDWWDPYCHYTGKTFRYPRYQSALLRTLLLTYLITEDARYLAPIETLASLRRAYLAGEGPAAEDGNVTWSIAQVGGAVRDVLSKYRAMTGETGWDDVLMAEGSPYLRYLMTQDESIVTQAVEGNRASFAYDEVMFTSEVRFTDRLFKFHAKYANEYRGESTPSFDATLLYNMVTGDVGDPAILPLNAVKWHTEPRDIAVLVGSQSTSQFVAQLYHFGSDERSLTATFYRLNSGQYDWQLSCEGQSTIEGQHDIQSAFSLTLPSQKHCTLTLSAVR